MEKISVIVPVYNTEKYLPACLDSLLAQTFKNIEIICIDDGSTDNSYEILVQYAKKDTRIKVFQQSNQGVAAARNKALELAQGEWLAFCDSDDTVPPRAYEYLYNATKDVDVVIGDYCKINDFGEKLKHKKKGKENSDLVAAMFTMTVLWTKLIKRSFVLNNKIKLQEVSVGEDMIFLADIIAKNPKYKIISKTVYYYWEHNKDNSKSLTHQYNYNLFFSHLYCRKEVLRILWKEQRIEAVCELIQKNMLAPLVQHMLCIQDFQEREKAFTIFKEFITEFNWTNKQGLFFATTGVTYEEFIDASAMSYFSTNSLFNPAEIVLRRYEAGQIGFRYILKYINAWVKYKLKNF